MGRHQIQIIKEDHKFSCAHMTVFPDGSKERLHGHNFQLALSLELKSVALRDMCDFGPIKQVLRTLCSELNEHVLVALGNEHLRVAVESVDDREVVRLCHPSGEYLLPRGDVLLLPIENVTTEQLARYLHGELCQRLRSVLPAVVLRMEVGVLETPGQGGFYEAPIAG